eukprot:2440536-Prymnesium_polylepis.1
MVKVPGPPENQPHPMAWAHLLTYTALQVTPLACTVPWLQRRRQRPGNFDFENERIQYCYWGHRHHGKIVR